MTLPSPRIVEAHTHQLVEELSKRKGLHVDTSIDKWKRRHHEMAAHIAQYSKDPSTKVGAIIVDSDNVVRATGYNGFPRGVNDTEERLAHRPTKYAFTVHAEANAILNAARSGASVRDCVLYVTHPPCNECAKAIIQAGIARVSVPLGIHDMLERWREEWKIADQMFHEADVWVELFEMGAGQ